MNNFFCPLLEKFCPLCKPFAQLGSRLPIRQFIAHFQVLARKMSVWVWLGVFCVRTDHRKGCVTSSKEQRLQVVFLEKCRYPSFGGKIGYLQVAATV